MLILPFLHAVSVLLLPLGLCLDTNVTITLFAAFLHILGPAFKWCLNEVAVNLVTGTIGCCALEQQNCAELARSAVVELDFAVLHQVSHYLLVHSHEEKVIEVGNND